VPKLPNPPAVAALAKIAAEKEVLPKGTLISRIYARGGRYPSAWNAFRGFGPTGSRFDHQLPPKRVQKRRILYGATNGDTCFAECFQSARMIDCSLDDPWLVTFELARDVTLLDLTGAWPTRAGASMAINSGPRPRARLWSQVIYAAYPDIEGLWYCSSMDANRPAVALYERAKTAIPVKPTVHRSLSDAALAAAVKKAASRFGYGVV
jgi:hypothetical protein